MNNIKIALCTVIISAVMASCKSNKVYVQQVPTETIEVVAPNHDAIAIPQDYVKYVIALPKTKIESNYKIEFFAGKMMEVDCNKHFISGEFTQKSIAGQGNRMYYIFQNHNIVSAKMACINKKLETKFISSNSVAERYNSSEPTIVLVPKDMVVKYKIWTASAEEKQAIEKQ